MPFEKNRDQGRHAAALLASVFVFIGGLLTCVFIALAFADRPLIPLGASSVYLATVILLIWLGRERPGSKSSGARIFQHMRKVEETALRYEPMRRKKPKIEVLGPNEPPTAESIQELSDSVNNWVPSNRKLNQ